jgi:hypothetical protein
MRSPPVCRQMGRTRSSSSRVDGARGTTTTLRLPAGVSCPALRSPACEREEHVRDVVRTGAGAAEARPAPGGGRRRPGRRHRGPGRAGWRQVGAAAMGRLEPRGSSWRVVRGWRARRSCRSRRCRCCCAARCGICPAFPAHRRKRCGPRWGWPPRTVTTASWSAWPQCRCWRSWPRTGRAVPGGRRPVAGCLAVTYRLRTRRDPGHGLIPERPGPAASD